MLAISALDRMADSNWRGYVLPVMSVLMLLAGVCQRCPFASNRARLWAMDRGYAMWVACYSDLPLSFKAKAAGLQNHFNAFRNGLPLVIQMCTKSWEHLTAA